MPLYDDPLRDAPDDDDDDGASSLLLPSEPNQLLYDHPYSLHKRLV